MDNIGAAVKGTVVSLTSSSLARRSSARHAGSAAARPGDEEKGESRNIGKVTPIIMTVLAS